MRHEEELILAKRMLSEAEAALKLQIHRPEYDHQLCTELADTVRIARHQYLDMLGKFWSENE